MNRAVLVTGTAAVTVALVLLVVNLMAVKRKLNGA